MRHIVVPLVDDGTVENTDQLNALIEFLESQKNFILDKGVQVLFESDYGPKDLKEFIEKFDSNVFGINYDIGNSASLGYDPYEEFSSYGVRIQNVHIKDRVLNGTTVALGQGNADFDSVFKLLETYKYEGNLILQTARATDNDHESLLLQYKIMVENWKKKYES